MRKKLPPLLFVITVMLTSIVTAQDEAASPESVNNAENAKSRSKSIKSQQIETALDFARKHHSELAELLNQLRDKSPAGFKRGIREVHRSIQHLERFREKQPSKFSSELNKWKTDSRIRLIVAKWITSQDPELEKTIHDLLRKRQHARLDRLTRERDRVALRLKQVDAQIVRASEEEALTQEWEQLKKRTTIQINKRRSKKVTSGRKPVVKETKNVD